MSYLPTFDSQSLDLTRRRFLQVASAGAGVASVGLTLGGSRAWAGPPLGDHEGVLVVVELNGGNDGLNTVTPIDDGRYRSLRSWLALDQSEVHRIDEGLALHPSLGSLKNRYDRGDVAIVQGVGYANPSLSHFESMALWREGHAGAVAGVRADTGWIGRYLDARGAERDPLNAAVFDTSIPLSMVGREASAATLRSEAGMDFGVRTDGDWLRMYDAVAEMSSPGSPYGPWVDAVAANTQGAVSLAGQLAPAYVGTKIPGGELERNFGRAARLINVDLGIRVIGLEAWGYDTHNAQSWRHGDLLRQLDAAIERFFLELDPIFSSRVTLMVTSEFGRRPEMNGAGGTDHGTANVAFVIGERVKGGLYGEYPSLSALDSRGNLEAQVDFRSLYATMLERWLAADSVEILGGHYELIDLFGSVPDGGSTVGGAPNPFAKHGYMMATSAGVVYHFGKHANFGSPWVSNAVALRRHPTGDGYWLCGSDGGVFTYGAARFHGSLGSTRLSQPIVDMAAHPSGDGYWLCGADGGVFSFGGSRFHGSTGHLRLNEPIVAMAAHPDGGYWLAASDGGIFAFGAPFHGSAGGIRLTRPIVAMAATPSGNGYWLAASDGGVFAFGDAGFYGSTGAIRLAQPVVDMAATPSGNGYWLAASDGGVFTFGDATFQGSLGSTDQRGFVVSFAS